VTLDQARQQPVAQSRWQARWAAIRAAPRVVVLGLFILCTFVVFGQRLWHLQFVRGEYYRGRAERQRLRSVTIPAARGIVYDRYGTPLVRNVPSFDVTIVPAYLPDDEDEMEDVLIRLAMLLDMPYTTAGARGAGDEPPSGLCEMVDAVGYTARYRPLVVKRGVDRDTALLVAQQALLLPGVSVQVESARDYPYGPLVSQILGYLSPIPEEDEEEYVARGYDSATDRVGVAGVEVTYEDVLRGQKGRQIIEEDVTGRVIRVIEEQAAPVPGHNIYLTLDLDLQRFVEGALRDGMAQPDVNSPRGVAIVMDPQTGAILALVSLPTYDNNLFAQGISTGDWQRLRDDLHRPLLNHAISDRLPPGSVFKIVVAAGALQEGVLTPYTRLSCPGRVVVPNKYYPNDPGRAQPFYCWNKGGHGWLDIVGGIANSCDIFFYKVGGGFEETRFEGLGVSRIARYARLFGFGEPTGVELPAEAGGLVPAADWKRLTYGESWSTGDTYNLSIGQGFLAVTPLQMLNAVNAVANSGTLYRPRVVHHVTDAQGDVTQPFEPETMRTLPISAEHWSLIQQGMEGAVVYGTARRVQIEGVRVAGKTGTAQFCDDIMCGVGYEQPEHAWFAAFAPVEEPEVSVIVFMYNGGEGSVVAVPVAHDILEYYFNRDEAAP
jgi:penicillin-binding protein 2